MKALALVSGGFDSPVAVWKMQQQGVEVIGIHFSYEPITDNAPEMKVRAACRILGIKKLIVMRAGTCFADLASQCDHRLYYVLGKRLMMRWAEVIAKREGCDCLITGENLAQVGSQTLQNLMVIDAAASLQVIRPLLCYDKVEIIDLAKKIGTYEISKGPEVCDCLGPVHPATSSRLEQVEEEEKKIDWNVLWAKAEERVWQEGL